MFTGLSGLAKCRFFVTFCTISNIFLLHPHPFVKLNSALSIVKNCASRYGLLFCGRVVREFIMKDIQKQRDRWNRYRRNHLEQIREKERKWRAANRAKDNKRKRNHEKICGSSWEAKATRRCYKRAREKHIPRNFKPSDLYNVATGALPVFCPIFPHIKLDYNKGRDMRCWASVDRKVPELGYVSGNVWVISMAANTWKSNGSNPQERARIVALMSMKKHRDKSNKINQLSLFSME
jgi:hypothetical protein